MRSTHLVFGLVHGNKQLWHPAGLDLVRQADQLLEVLLDRAEVPRRRHHLRRPR